MQSLESPLLSAGAMGREKGSGQMWREKVRGGRFPWAPLPDSSYAALYDTGLGSTESAWE